MKLPTKYIKQNNQFIAFPKNTIEVSKLVIYARKNKFEILPIGGETNRVDGTKSDSKKIIKINFRYMSSIDDIDINNYIITAQCGVLLKTIQQSASKKGLFFPVNIAPHDKCTIGGNISTNVGGLQTLRYGNIEDHINGLEVVLSDGTIINFLSKLKKDNFGPKLWKIFCGSEGIFGIITKANLKLIPKKKYRTTYLLTASSLNKSVKLLKNLRKNFYDNLTSFEIIFPNPSNYLFEKNDNNFNLIIEIQSNYKNNYKKDVLSNIDKNNFRIIRVEENIYKSWIWKKREELVYNQSKYNYKEKFDISLPLDKWPLFINKVKIFTKNNKFFTPYFFGHLGDGNLHCNFKIEPDTKKIMIYLQNLFTDL